MSTWSAINYHLSNDLSYGIGYSLDEVYGFYYKLMFRDSFCQLTLIKKDSLRKRLNQWCEVEGGWLRKDASGDVVMYYKREPVVNCPFLNLVEWVRSKVWKQ